MVLEEEVDSYVALRINRRHGSEPVQTLVWRINGWGWDTIEEAENTGFRGVLKLTSVQAWDLKEQMETSGWLTAPSHSTNKTLELMTKRLSDRPIYVFYRWDEEEGAVEPIAKIRCHGMYAAERYFADRMVSKLQIKHISGCVADWDAIANLDLEQDLITEGSVL